jgi:hypothetical protein
MSIISGTALILATSGAVFAADMAVKASTKFMVPDTP